MDQVDKVIEEARTKGVSFFQAAINVTHSGYIYDGSGADKLYNLANAAYQRTKQ